MENILIAKASVIMSQTSTSKLEPKGKGGRKEKKTKQLGKLVSLEVTKIRYQSRKALPKKSISIVVKVSKILSKTLN